MQIKVDRAELDTILAALRWYQHSGHGEPSNRPQWLHDIATDSDNASLDASSIDELCERLNCTPEGCEHCEHMPAGLQCRQCKRVA